MLFRSGSLELYVAETDWRDATTDEPVLVSRFTLAVSVKPPKD